MAIRCEEEFNPWPSFVDIFSSVILVLMLFLLVIIVNLGYYAQFKYKVSYTGSVTTDDIILQDISKKVILDEDKKVEDPNQDHLVPKELMTPKTEMEMMKKIEQQQKIIQQMQQQMQQEKAATDIESAGEDIADKKKKDEKSKQKITQSDKVFYITYNGNELFIDQGVTEKLKTFMAKAKQDNPNAIVNIYGTDPLDQISLTVTKQITLGRAISVRNLIRKFQFEKHQIKVKLADKPSIPRDIKIDTGVIVVEVTD